MAQSLFEEGRRLMKAGDVARACASFAESWRLERVSATLLNLAACHREEGKTATAWTEFRQAQAISERDGRQDRAAEAKAQSERLIAMMSYVTISAPWQRAGEGFKLDGTPISRGVLGQPLPVDPGLHTLDVTAEGAAGYRMTIEVPKGPATTGIVLRDPGPSTTPPPAPPTPLATAEPGAGSDRDREGSRAPVYVAGGIGAAFAVATGVFGAFALERKSAIGDACGAGVCTPEGQEINEDAHRWAAYGTATFVGTLVAAAVATVLYFTTGPKSSSPRRGGP